MALRGTVWTTLGNYLNLIVSFVTTLALTRLISPDIFGIVSLATFWASLLNLRSKSGLLYAASQQRETNGALLGTYLFLDAGIAVLSVVGGIFVSLVMLAAGLQAREVAFAVVVMLFADALMVVAGPWQMALEKELHLSRLAIITLLATILSSVFAIFFAVKGESLVSLLSMSILTALVSTIGIIIVGRRLLPGLSGLHWKFDRALSKAMLARGLTAGLSLALLVGIVGQFDNFLIGTFVGKETLGFYDRAYRIASWPNVLLTIAAARVGLQTMARLRGDKPRLTHTVRLWLWLATTLGIPMALTLCFGADEIVTLLYGPAFAPSSNYLRFLSITNLAWVFISVAFWLSVALGNRRANVKLSMAQAIVLVAVATPLTLRYGVAGTMMGVGLSMILAVFLGSRYIFLTVDLNARAVYGAPIVSAGLTMLSLLALSASTWLMRQSSIVKIMLIVVVAFGVYGASLIVVQRKETMSRLAYLAQTWKHGG